jgi:hypothetical protein
MLDEAGDPQPPIAKAVALQLLVLGAVRQPAVVPEVWRDVLFGEGARFGIHPLQQTLQGPDQGVPDPLHDAGMPDGDRGGRHPADRRDHHGHTKDAEPIQPVSSRLANMWLRFRKRLKKCVQPSHARMPGGTPRLSVPG